MSSLERVKYFTENAPLEEDEFAEEFDALPKGWPSEGKIVVQNLSMRYRDGPLILKDLTFSTKPREKVGICGRTGSGKVRFCARISRPFKMLYHFATKTVVSVSLSLI
jgi:ABC-type multidrug transport system fused ATPase/permease subunit